MRSPGRRLTPWLKWHAAIGIERFYLFFDADPEEAAGALAASFPGVRAVIVDRAARARMAKDPYCAPLLPLSGEPDAPVGSPEQLTARQLCNAKVALDMARRDGVAWVLHIDADELFYPKGGDAAAHFAALSGLGIGYVIYDNHEAVCEKAAYEDPFSEITLFKLNARVIDPDVLAAREPYFAERGGYFLAYANGKAACRAVPGAEPAGVHGFHLPFSYGFGRCRLSDPAILHYPYTNFDDYWRKFQRLGDYPGDVLLGRKWWPPLFELQSRDLCCAGKKDEARKVYRRATMLRDARKIEAWTREGVLARIREPARLLGGK
jgi:hypothetical protein